MRATREVKEVSGLYGRVRLVGGAVNNTAVHDVPSALKALGTAVEALRSAVKGLKGRAAPFEEREVTGVYLAPNGEVVKQIRVGPEQVPEFAAPTPWHATQLEGPASIEERYPDAQAPDGNPHGDEKIIRRRRATELERLIMEARKNASRGTPAERERWDQELMVYSNELEAIREAERRERDEYRKV